MQYSIIHALLPILDVLKAFGLPKECLSEPIKWQGTRDQQEALHQLHTALNIILPKLPGQLPAQPFVYCPETDPDVETGEMLVEINDLRELLHITTPDAFSVTTTAEGLTITAATKEREQEVFDLLKTWWEGVLAVAQDLEANPQNYEGHNASLAEWRKD